jgi:5'(3')-deoxyribonucleotidase
MKIFEIEAKPHLYLDMDGVQADFFTQWARLHQKRSYKEIGDKATREQSIKELNAKGSEFVYNFFKNLPPLHGGLELVSWLKKNKILFTVLSAPLYGNEEASIAGKKVWLDRYNPGTSTTAIFTSEKYQFALRGGQSNILVDDFKKYINAWRDAGGIGILYRDHQVADVIEILKDIYGTKTPNTFK